jgi:hypothetical protein
MADKTLRVVYVVAMLVSAWTMALAQNAIVPWYSFNMGFVESGDLLAVAGQSFVGTTSEAGTTVLSGFLADTLFRGPVTRASNPDELPLAYWLGQNYPNPFNPATTIRYELPVTSVVTLKLYNTLGQEVMQIVDGEEQPGTHILRLDAGRLASGVYFYRLTAAPATRGAYLGFKEVKKLVVVK